ncbi:MAG: phage tail length tape measure family protein [Acidiferrobacterales bacterium]|nr:phage tail length tape measure family protein [Acidiferrobacterales bacterium]
MANEDLGTISYTVDAKTKPLLDANKQIDASLNTVEKGFISTGAAAGKFDTQLTKTASGVKRSGEAMRRMKGQAQNLGFQLQDIAVQAQMGTNSLVILGQQGSQILGAFGATGALAGAALAIGAALAGVASKALGAGEAVQDYKSELELLQQTVKVTDDGITQFSDGFAKLAQERPEIAISKLNTELSRSDSILKIVSNDASDLVDDFANFSTSAARNELETFGSDVANIVKETTPLTTGQLFKSAFTGSAVRPYNEIRDAVSNLMDEFELSRDQAARLSVALSNVNTPQGVIEASAVIEDLASSSDNSNVKLDRLNVKMFELGERAKNLVQSQESLNSALNDVADVGDQSEKAIEKNKEAMAGAAAAALDLQQKILISKTAMEEGEEAAIRQSVAMSLGSQVSEELKNKVADLAVEYFNLTQAQKEAAKEQREQETLNKNAQKLAEDARNSNLSEIEQIRQKAQAQRDLINASTELSALQKSQAIGNINQQEQQSVDRATFGTDDPNNIALQNGLNITKEMADQVQELDDRMMNLGTTINDTLVGSALTFGDTIGNAFASAIASGDSLNDTFKNIAGTIAQQVLAQLISVGVQYGINAALKTGADATMAAGSIASITATTAAGVTSATTLANAYAPAAAAAAVATSGGAAAAGTAGLVTAYSTSNALSLAGGRLNGGSVSPNSAYQVTENGKPEMLTVGGKNILMTGSQGGTVTSNKDLVSGGSGGTVVNVYNQSSNSEATTTSTTQDGKEVISIVVADINNRGKIHKAMTNTTTANNKT